ncbi:hypothetical protein MTO96_016616 [Rhipicephalus appendiculatus]
MPVLHGTSTRSHPRCTEKFASAQWLVLCARCRGGCTGSSGDRSPPEAPAQTSRALLLLLRVENAPGTAAAEAPSCVGVVPFIFCLACFLVSSFAAVVRACPIEDPRPSPAHGEVFNAKPARPNQGYAPRLPAPGSN